MEGGEGRSMGSRGNSNSGYCPHSSIYHSKRKPVPLPTIASLTLPSILLHSDLFPLPPHHWPAFTDAHTGLSLSHGQFRLRILSVASSLSAFGIRHGDVVFIISPNSLHSPVLMLACMLAGAIVTLANPLNSPAEIAKQIADSGAAFVSTIPPLLPKLGKCCSLPLVLLPEGPETSLVSPLSPWPCRCVPFAELLHSNSNPNTADTYGSSLSHEHGHGQQIQIHIQSHSPQPYPNQDDTAALLYSSGTTGASKGVMISHRNLIAATSIIFNSEGPNLRPDLVSLCIIPIFHVYGLVAFVCALPALGSSVIMMSKFDIQEMLELIQRCRVTNLPLVPPILLALTKTSIADQYDLSSLTEVMCGAAPLSEELATAFKARFPNVSIRQGYGLTESPGGGSFHITKEECEHRDSVGLLAPNTEAKIVDMDSGKFLPPNHQGELWLRGPTVMKGYFANPAATAATIDQEGWLHTGDLCRFDEVGYLYVIDRIKELIKYKGFQVAPAELEAVLLSHPEIVDAAVIPLSDEAAGQVPSAFIVPRPNCIPTEAEVITFVSNQVAPYKKIRHVVFVKEIPKSPSGKILRRELLKITQSKF